MAKIIKQISTHKAICNGNKIDILSNGLVIDGEEIIKERYLYSIPKENEDDLFAIFERYEENNRINRNEFFNSML